MTNPLAFTRVCACAVLLTAICGAQIPKPRDEVIVVPKLWDAKVLEDWATPLAGLGVPPTLLSEAQYYAAPIDDLRTYPVYHPAFEPKGYREGLAKLGPQRLIEPEKLKTKADWIEAGRQVFECLDTPSSRSDDQRVIAHFTDAKAIDKFRDGAHDVIDRNGVLLDYRWVVEPDGKLELSFSSCYGCHSRLMPDGSVLVGAPCNFELSDAPATQLMLDQIAPTLPSLSPGEKLYASFGVPWRPDDEHARFKTMQPEDLGAFFALKSGAPPGTTFARFNGSPFHEARMADLRGVRDRRYLDATGTHKNRGPEDIARYGILVEYASEIAFGPHRPLSEAALKGALAEMVRPPDAAMYALGLYVYSLDPAPSPFLFDELAKAGQAVFESEGCAKCHAPPCYTNNKLVPVPGFDPPLDDPRTAKLDISNRRVGTDPGMALRTRKGTGYYKVPSLRGVWYRGLYGHSGFVTSLEEWFDPKRVREDFQPSGWKGPGVKTLALPGHDFGFDLSGEEKKALIAFLKTL